MPDVTVDAPTGAETVVPEVPSFEAYLKTRNQEPEVKQEPAATETEAKTEEASEASSEQEDSSERDDKGRFKPKKSEAEKRIDKLTAKYREAERERDELRRQLEDRATKPAETQKTETKEADKTAKPKVGDFESYEDYVEALTDWKTDQKLAAARERDAAEAKKQSEAAKQKTNAQKWQESESVVREKYADYDDVIQEAAEDIKSGKLKSLPDEAFAAIMESDSKAELFYHLAKNREDLGRLTNASSERAMLLELGKIEAKITAPPVQEAKKVPSIPKPPSTVGGTAKGGSSADAKDFNTFYARRMAEKYRR